MTETATESDPAAESDPPPVHSRVLDRLTSISPFSLALLGPLGFVGDQFPSLEIFKLFYLFGLFAFWPFAAMLVSAVRDAFSDEEQTDEADETDPRDWLVMDDGLRPTLAFLGSLIPTFLNPLVLRQDVMQLLGSFVAIVRHRGSLPSPETYAQSASYRLPVEGDWAVVNGSPIKDYSHSWFPATQRYAYDFVITDEEGRTRPEDADTSIENYYCYDAPVVAPADGTVVAVGDGDPEFPRGGGFSHPLKRSVVGNSVTIRHAESEYSTLVHLVPGSIAVEPGDRVERGEQIGRCGHSGNSAEPHLHFQMQDHPAFELAAGLPNAFDDIEVETPGTDVTKTADWTAPDTEEGRQYVHVGQRVSQADQLDQTATETEPDDTVDNRSWTVGRLLGGVASGVAVGGILTVFAGIFLSTLSTIAVVLGGAMGLAVASRLFESVTAGRSLGRDAVPFPAGLAIAAGLVSGLDVVAGVPEASAVPLGIGLFGLGFLSYVVSWRV